MLTAAMVGIPWVVEKKNGCLSNPKLCNKRLTNPRFESSSQSQIRATITLDKRWGIIRTPRTNSDLVTLSMTTAMNRATIVCAGMLRTTYHKVTLREFQNTGSAKASA